MTEATLAAGENGTRTFRGGSIEELLPRIREELGSEAVILRQREGLVGGVGGFFQKRCVEVEARAGAPGVDVYDEPPQDEGSAGPRVLSRGEGPAGGAVAPFSDPPPAPPAAEDIPPAADAAAVDGLVRNDAATREGLASAGVRELVENAEPFAQMLEGYGAVAAEPGVAAASEVAAAAEVEMPAKGRSLIEGMVGCGVGVDVAEEIVAAVLASAMPFATPGRLRTLVRDEVAVRLPVARLAGPGARTVVVVGPEGSGKDAALAALAGAHEAAGTPVKRIEVERLGGATPPAGGLLAVETPPLWGGAAELAAVAAALGALEGAEVHLALRAGTAAPAAAELLEGLAPLAPNRLLLTGAGETSHLGGALDLALRAGLPLGYVAESAGEIAPAEPRGLARRIVP